MSEVMDVLNAFATPLKIAWLGWIAWGVGQYFWFRHERSMPMKKRPSVARPTAKNPAVPRPVAAPAVEAPVVGRLFTPTHVVADTKPSAPVMPQMPSEPSEVPAPTSVTAVAAAEETLLPAFDPSKAVIEQFGATSDDVLDRFVRDFEMQDARPRRRSTTRVPETLSYGAEAPQVP
jgi:hypothetical protein